MRRIQLAGKVNITFQNQSYPMEPQKQYMKDPRDVGRDVSNGNSQVRRQSSAERSVSISRYERQPVTFARSVSTPETSKKMEIKMPSPPKPPVVNYKRSNQIGHTIPIITRPIVPLPQCDLIDDDDDQTSNRSGQFSDDDDVFGTGANSPDLMEIDGDEKIINSNGDILQVLQVNRSASHQSRHV